MDAGAGSGCGWVLRQLLLFVAAVWLGSFLGVAALAAGMAVGGVHFTMDSVWLLFISPAFLLTHWMWVNGIILFSGLLYFLRAEVVGVMAWGMIAGLESLVVMLGWMDEFPSMVGAAVGWGAWLVFLGMMGTALWFFRQWMLNRWAAELAVLHAENATRRADQEEV